MKKTNYLFISLVLMLVVSSWSPSLVTTGWAEGQTAGKSSGETASTQASTLVTLTINNPLPKAATVTLTGAKTYTINVPMGATITRSIDPGKYKYSYLGCLNKAKKGNLKIKGAAASLTIPACKMATGYIFNADDSRPATLRLKGWVNYTVTVGPGQAKQFSWVADQYQYTLDACGKTYNGTLKVKGKKSWIIRACD